MTSALGFKGRIDPSLARFHACITLRFTSGATPADCFEVSMADTLVRDSLAWDFNFGLSRLFSIIFMILTPNELCKCFSK